MPKRTKPNGRRDNTTAGTENSRVVHGSGWGRPPALPAQLCGNALKLEGVAGNNPPQKISAIFFLYWQWKRRQIAGAARVGGRLQSGTERRRERRRSSLDAASNCQLIEWRKWAESSEHVIQWDPELTMTCGGLIRLMGKSARFNRD